VSVEKQFRDGSSQRAVSRLKRLLLWLLPRQSAFLKRSKESSSFLKQNSDAVAFRKRSKPAAIARVRSFAHDLPTIGQHACNVLIHCLHARQQSLPIVFPRPISLVGKRFHFHIRHSLPISQLSSLSGAIGWRECPTNLLLYSRRTDSEAQEPRDGFVELVRDER
jgi:hypothetical protein